MQIAELSRQHQRLRSLIGEAAEFDAAKFELAAHWGRYLCVLVSGFLENAIGEIYSEYARRCANQNVATFVQSAVLKVQNPKSTKFVEVARGFNKAWADDLEAFLSQDGRKEAIDAIIANRHAIAHGGTTGITVGRVSEYLDKCVAVIEFLEGQCAL